MSLIEQAAKRLEELRRAGVEVPDTPAKPHDTAAAPAHVNELASAKLQVATPGQARRPRGGIAAAPTPRAPLQHSPDDPRLVHLDLAHISAKGIITPEAPRSQTADEFRVIKRPLIQNATGKGAAPIKQGNLIMVTSALPGEGKSFTAVNLAMSIAMDTDQPVLLIDADVSNPSVSELLGLPPGPGLLDVLAGTAELSDALLRTQIDGLSVLPIGDANVRATELIASGTMRSLLDNLSACDPDLMLIFDAPPLLAATEARELASHMSSGRPSR